MFGVVAYIGECLGVAGAITLIYVMTRSLKTRDEIKSWKVFLNLAIIALILPYSAVEAVTKVVGKKLEPVVRETVDGTDFAGDFGYFKVVYYTGKTAKVVAVGTEKTGLSDAALAAADARVRIPMAGAVNSLNAGVSAAVVLFEAVRQRSA